MDKRKKAQIIHFKNDIDQKLRLCRGVKFKQMKFLKEF